MRYARSDQGRRGVVVALVCTLAVSSAARADNRPSADATVGDETIVVVGAARGGVDDLVGDAPGARDGGRALGEAPFVTIVHSDDHEGELATMAEVLGESVGVQTRSLGGLGAFASISVRGASAGHTAVLVDGVPLSRIASVTADLGRFELDGFDQIELYRGAVPVRLGGAGVGGALNLVTRLGPDDQGHELAVSLGYGSFGARHFRARYGGSHRHDSLRSVLSIGYTGATGDYSYFSNNNTTLNPNDDSYQTRTNNGFNEGDLVARIGSTGDDASALGIRVLWKDQGLPGPSWAQAIDASLSTVSLMADASTRTTISNVLCEQRAYALGELQHYQDLHDEIGLAEQDHRYRLGVVGGASAWTMPTAVGPLSAILDGRGEWFRDVDELANKPGVTGNRQAIGAATSLDIGVLQDSLTITPAVRFDSLRTDPIDDDISPLGTMALAPRWDNFLSPRGSVRWLPIDDVAIKGSVGRYVRFPTVLELFGNRGYIVGSPNLLAETGVSTEVGVVWAPRRALGITDRILLEATTFASWPHNTIALIASASDVERPLNIGDSRMIGAELGTSLRLAKRVTIAANYTRLATTQYSAEASYDGKALPREPENVVYARVDFAEHVMEHLVDLWFDIDWQSSSFLDQSNVRAVPGRTLGGVGVKLAFGAGVVLGFDVKNLGDTRIEKLSLANPPRPDLAEVPIAVSDVAGYPLPGRSFYLTLEWKH